MLTTLLNDISQLNVTTTTSLISIINRASDRCVQKDDDGLITENVRGVSGYIGITCVCGSRDVSVCLWSLEELTYWLRSPPVVQLLALKPFGSERPFRPLVAVFECAYLVFI